MGSNMWKKAKFALGLNLCVSLPKTRDDEDKPWSAVERTSDVSTATDAASTKTCAICLGNMKAGHGAIFTAECSHAFHFSCIASNVKYGNHVCPVCRAKWKEIPFPDPISSEFPHGRTRVNPINWVQDDGTVTLLRRLPRVDSSNRRHHLSCLFSQSEPNIYDDDDPVVFLAEASKDSETTSDRTVHIKAYPEFPSLAKTASEESFTILIHLKAPSAVARPGSFGSLNTGLPALQPSRAPVDLVTVLDISGSMAGTKLALLKRAMGFVIQNLGPADRLSVIAFSSTARRLFPLRRMSESGRQNALQAVNSLVSSGGTNIAEGLRKGAKVIEERKEKNSVCSVILFSDGQDTYTMSSTGSGVNRTIPDYQSLVPPSIRGGADHQIPVHAFGFGADHDSNSMHTISDISGGTFSFIEADSVIQDAFAQCIGGLLSVVVQELQVVVECMHAGVKLAPIRSGSYASQVVDGLKGSISVGDLYADEERDFLVSLSVPPVSTEEEILLVEVGCCYRDPLSKEIVSLVGQQVSVERPESVAGGSMSIEVDRERNRVRATEAMNEARSAADRGGLSEAVLVLESERRMIRESLAGRSGDRLCVSLDAELKEMQQRMQSRQRYEESGRAYVLSGLSSHSWQRATARGDSTDSTSLVHAYQTPSMVDMLQRSQTLLSSPSSPRRPRPPILPSKSFPSHPVPR
ncbi:RING-H2 finger protein ATL70 [Apostasia shenzhenica]|uniref:RING-H2 finger protein ATL70 n=1 Tax=Apostasia shenzhenica TaxID=1088818 RepID=A0A2I0AHP3_9ASPA|nr:RING-H2 finger protein ATL70 [Apostasia shenzhenica]